MAEDPHFASRPESKRKYEDQLSSPPPPPARRATGFSAPIASLSPDSKINNAVTGSYNTVPPPADEIQIAKQRAQEIAARLFNMAEANRPRTEGGSTEEDFTKKPYGQQTFNSQLNVIPPTSLPGTYGFSGNTKKIDIPNGKVGVIIGKAGETIKYLQLQSGAKIQVTRDMDADPTSQTRPVELMGTAEQISKAEQLINEAIAEAEAGSGTTRRFNSGQMGSEQFVMEVPNNKVGLIIGKGGETIKNMQSRSGARIQLIPLHLPPGDTSTERTVQIDGTKEQIESAKQLINEVVSENRVRNPPMGGGYPQQGYRPPRPPTNWGPPGHPMQQAGYGYMQPGTYPGQPPQYNTSQPPYGGLPPQPVTAGQPSGWDQSLAPPSQQSSGYDYYNQQSAQQQQPTSAGSAVGDNSSYNYGQQPVSNYNSQGSYAATTNYSQPQVGQQQGYVQDGYGGYHTTTPQPSYSQPQSNSQPGYNQPEGYSNAQGYQAMTNTNQDPGAPSYGVQGGPIQVPSSQQVPQPVQPPPAASQQGGYTSQSPATTTANYVSQGTPTQPGYGVPPTSQPSYGNQSSDQTGYSQPTPLTPSYGQPQGQQPPPTQPVYRQSPQQAPTTQGGYAASAQPGYSHSQPPTAQSGYGQQDPSLNHGQPSSYGSAAPQPGYGQQHIYGAPQPGYGQAYNDSYGSSVGGYSQLPAYSSDNGAGGNAHGAYDAAPSGGAQPVQSGVAKASPQT